MLSALLAITGLAACVSTSWASSEAKGPHNSDGSGQRVLAPGHPQPQTTTRPNIVFILTDDQDLHMNSLDYLPLIKKHLIDRGTLYKKHFCTTAICCPARVSILTGKLSHNTNVTDITPPYGTFHLAAAVLHD